MLYQPLISLCTLVALSSCSLSDLVNKAQVPANLRDPTEWENEAGALAFYNGMVWQIRAVAGGSGSNNPIGSAALLTDEMTATFLGANPATYPTNSEHVVDARLGWDHSSATASLGNGIKNSYNALHSIRIRANTARQYLQRYGEKLPPDLIGHTLVIEAYSIWFLSELFCSGVPLSHFNFDGSYTLDAGTRYEDAIAVGLKLLDSADLYLSDSTRFISFANLMRGRLLLADGRYTDAAAAVEMVKPSYVYQARFNAPYANFLKTQSNGSWLSGTIADNEGRNGLNFVSSRDPRTLTISTANGVNFPLRFNRDGSSPIAILTGIERFLISAEARLQSTDITGWLEQLNLLRNSGIARIDTAISGVQDTIWASGLGASLYAGQATPFPGLSNLEDPGSDTARVSLLFRERAFWLFLTGNRQSDMRRLVRQYKRPENEVYPIGLWGPMGQTSYGGDVMFPVPGDEVVKNRRFSGCVSRDA